MTTKSNQPATRTATKRLREQAQARRPWQILIVGMGANNTAVVSAETTDALTRLFEYLPGLSGVTLKTANGDLQVSRDFPSGEMQIIDCLIASVFENDPHITGVAFPSRDGQVAHIATPENPSFLARNDEQPALLRDA